MYLENVKKYVTFGMDVNDDVGMWRKQGFGFVLLTVMTGTVPGVILRGHWIYLTLAMYLISIACMVSVFILTSQVPTLEEWLWIHFIVAAGWVLDLSILMLMYFTIWKGFSPWLLLMHVPAIIVPLILGIRNYHMLKSDNYNTQKIAKGNFITVGFSTGLVGVSFARILFRNVDQSTIFIVTFTLLTLLNGLMSIGLVSIQKIYFMYKYKIYKY